MFCKKCNSIISDDIEICPYCGFNQKENIEIKQNQFFIDVAQEDLKQISKISKKKAIFILLTLFFIFVAIAISLLGIFHLNMTKAVESSMPMIEEQMKYFKDDSGNIVSDFDAPLEKEIATQFITDINNHLYDLNVEFFKLLDATNTYTTYNKFNVFQDNCKEINKEIKLVKNNFKSIETYEDQHLYGIKEYTYDKYFYPVFDYINTVTLSIMNKNIESLNSATLNMPPIMELPFATNMSSVATRANLTENEIKTINNSTKNEYLNKIKPYYNRLPKEQQKDFEKFFKY